MSHYKTYGVYTIYINIYTCVCICACVCVRAIVDTDIFT